MKSKNFKMSTSEFTKTWYGILLLTVIPAIPIYYTVFNYIKNIIDMKEHLPFIITVLIMLFTSFLLYIRKIVSEKKKDNSINYSDSKIEDAITLTVSLDTIRKRQIDYVMSYVRAAENNMPTRPEMPECWLTDLEVHFQDSVFSRNEDLQKAIKERL